jgi:hypothetical protein
VHIPARDSSAGIATGYGLDYPGSIPCRQDFLLYVVQTVSEAPTQPPIEWIPGVISAGVKRPGHEADRSPPSSAEVRNGGAIPPLPHRASCLSV